MVQIIVFYLGLNYILNNALLIDVSFQKIYYSTYKYTYITTLTAELLPHVGAGTGFEPVSKGYEPFKETTPPTCKIIKAHFM